MDWDIRACNEACGKKSGRRIRGDIWLWNEVVKEAMTGKKVVHKAMCRKSSQANKDR